MLTFIAIIGPILASGLNRTVEVRGITIDHAMVIVQEQHLREDEMVIHMSRKEES
jgi:hypothetical protein